MQELVELVLNDLQMKTEMGVPSETEPTCLEVGCGSGAISLSLLKSLPQVEFCASRKISDEWNYNKGPHRKKAV